MKEPIARIALAPGQVGYYDEYSRIHLTIGAPEATIYSGTNCAQIRRSIKSGRIRLLSGSLGAPVAPFRIIDTPSGKKIVSNVKKELEPVVAEIKPEIMPETTSAVEEKTEAVSEPVNKTASEVIKEEPVIETTEEAVVEATENISDVEAVKEKSATKKRTGRRKKAETVSEK